MAWQDLLDQLDNLENQVAQENLVFLDLQVKEASLDLLENLENQVALVILGA